EPSKVISPVGEEIQEEVPDWNWAATAAGASRREAATRIRVECTEAFREEGYSKSGIPLDVLPPTRSLRPTTYDLILIHPRQRHQPPSRRNPGLEFQNPDRRRNVVAPRPCPARIHHGDYHIHQLELRDVGVAV